MFRMNNNNINDVFTNLYEALVLVRYPGIAQIDLSNLEFTVLAENNRNSLLHWLLTQSVNAVDETLDIPTADETSLIKWYSQFGVCTNQNALLGQCPLTEQLDTLVNLTKFIRNVLGNDGNKSTINSDSDREILKDYIDNEINIFPPSCELPISNLTYKEAQHYIRNKNRSLKDRDNNIYYELKVDEMQNNLVSKNTKINSEVKINNQSMNSTIVDEFCEVFRSVDMCEDSKDQNSTKITKSVDNCIENIHKKFSTFNKTLRCKAEISNTVIPTELNIRDSPLNQIIQETAIGLENLSELHANDEEYQRLFN